jgi:hypothetical protein
VDLALRSLWVQPEEMCVDLGLRSFYESASRKCVCVCLCVDLNLRSSSGSTPGKCMWIQAYEMYVDGSLPSVCACKGTKSKPTKCRCI